MELGVRVERGVGVGVLTRLMRPFLWHLDQLRKTLSSRKMPGKR